MDLTEADSSELVKFLSGMSLNACDEDSTKGCPIKAFRISVPCPPEGFSLFTAQTTTEVNCMQCIE